MSGEKLIDALEFIDDDMIESVNALRKHPERHKHLWLNYVAVAACVMLAIFGGFKFFDSNVSTENNSSVNNGNTGEMHDDIENMFGDVENKIESADQITQDDNSSFRDEATGSTGDISGSSSTTGDVCFAATVYIEITEISESSFKGRIINRVTVNGATHFEKNQVVTVIYRESEYADYDTLLIKDLSVGEKVYVIFGDTDTDTIYTPYIRYDNNF